MGLEGAVWYFVGSMAMGELKRFAFWQPLAPLRTAFPFLQMTGREIWTWAGINERVGRATQRTGRSWAWA